MKFEHPGSHAVASEEEALSAEHGGKEEGDEPEYSAGERDLSREEIFREIINAGIYEDFLDALDDAHFDDDQVDEFKAAFKSLSPERLSGVFSLPYELRPIRLAKIKRAIEAGTLTPAEAVAELDAEARDRGFTLGYHVSPNQIPKGASRDGRTEWGIKGYEMDDRDNRPMAYYALDYENIFRKRPDTKYLYTVRAHIGEHTDHQLDTSNNWGRATGLSVIREFNIREVEEEVQREYERALKAHQEHGEHEQ